MNLTKGKLLKLYNKMKQTLKKFKKTNKGINRSRTFSRKPKTNLARLS
jgi:hypothetical protein